MGIPGATVIYASNFTKKENGIVSLAGPLTNFVVFSVFIALLYFLDPGANSYLYATLNFTIFVSILLAFFNMLPITPLDGSKIIAWNKPVYFSVLGVILALMLWFNLVSLWSLAFMLVIALVFSTIYRLAL